MKIKELRQLARKEADAHEPPRGLAWYGFYYGFIFGFKACQKKDAKKQLIKKSNKNCPCCGSNKTYETEAIHCSMCAVTTEI
jgi:hypothetical protein